MIMMMAMMAMMMMMMMMRMTMMDDDDDEYMECGKEMVRLTSRNRLKTSLLQWLLNFKYLLKSL